MVTDLNLEVWLHLINFTFSIDKYNSSVSALIHWIYLRHLMQLISNAQWQISHIWDLRIGQPAALLPKVLISRFWFSELTMACKRGTARDNPCVWFIKSNKFDVTYIYYLYFLSLFFSLVFLHINCFQWDIPKFLMQIMAKSFKSS